jgi:hypothetical protein
MHDECPEIPIYQFTDQRDFLVGLHLAIVDLKKLENVRMRAQGTPNV